MIHSKYKCNILHCSFLDDTLETYEGVFSKPLTTKKYKWVVFCFFLRKKEFVADDSHVLLLLVVVKDNLYVSSIQVNVDEKFEYHEGLRTCHVCSTS